MLFRHTGGDANRGNGPQRSQVKGEAIMHRIFAQTRFAKLIGPLGLQRVSCSCLVVVAALVLLAAVPAAWAQTTWHVDDDAALGGNGASWTTAFKSLQDALALTEADDEIRVADDSQDGVGTSPSPVGTQVWSAQLLFL